MPRIIMAIIRVQPTAMARKPALATPVATRATAITSIGMQQAIIIQPCPPCDLPRRGRIAEANGAAHAIDVADRRSVAGVDLLWIVECKHWNEPVPIEKVLALRSLVIDLGC